jgi:hypothetical protein
MYYFDDSGDRSDDLTRPYFVLGGFGIDADAVAELQDRIRKVARHYGFPLAHPQELKFNQVGRAHDNTPSKPHWMLRAGMLDRDERRAFVYACLRELAETSTVKILAVAVDRRETYGPRKPIVHAIEPLLERIDFDCKDHTTKGLVVCDEEQADDEALRSVTRKGSWYVRFFSIIDTLSFMPSTESIGVQLADLVAGSVSRYLNTGDAGYMRCIWSAFRKNEWDGRVNGYGIKVYPKGSCPHPPAQPVPWPPTDRRVHEIELRKRGIAVTWNEAGIPILQEPNTA